MGDDRFLMVLPSKTILATFENEAKNPPHS